MQIYDKGLGLQKATMNYGVDVLGKEGEKRDYLVWYDHIYHITFP
jgi:hypothetical protein